MMRVEETTKNDKIDCFAVKALPPPQEKNLYDFVRTAEYANGSNKDDASLGILEYVEQVTCGSE